ncbi:Hypothetical predicted protein [Pelobates cultripes]|uniref:Uncharacterized protein n=1 Tax=Pelobates cultripes TaxID=61616 RepID=A0AAD1W0P6_PELCU|nr:Hypothetical predicted protein [Pelobates cultripes]
MRPRESRAGEAADLPCRCSSKDSTSNPSNMATAMWHPDSDENHTDLMYKLDKILEAFWQKLEEKRHQTDPAQWQVQSPLELLTPQQRTPTAPAGAKAPKWWRSRRLQSLRQRAPYKQKPSQAKAESFKGPETRRTLQPHNTAWGLRPIVATTPCKNTASADRLWLLLHAKTQQVPTDCGYYSMQKHSKCHPNPPPTHSLTQKR